jgi:hypothetical protein
LISRLHARTFPPTLIPGLFLLVGAAGCGQRERLSGPADPGGDWTLGPATGYPVAGDAGASVADSLTGHTFRFPDGGSGTLQVSRILDGPSPPEPGQGFSVSFDREASLQIVVDIPGSAAVTVFGYGTAPGAYDDLPGPGVRWVALPQVDSLAEGRVFQLTLPFGTVASGKRRPIASTGGFSNYWISSIPAGSDEATQRLHIDLQIASVIDGAIALMPPALAASAREEIDGRLRRHTEWDGFFYSGFWWRSLGSLGRLAHPTIHLRLHANAGNVAHETGHYLTHAIVGDDTWSILEGQAPLWDTGHGIRDDVGRDVLVEDYAYVTEWIAIGSVKGYDLHDPYVIFSGRTPLASDFPGIEGFSAVLLAALTRTTPSMRDLIGGRLTDVPVIGLDKGDLYGIIARRAVTTEGLRAEIEAAAGPQADKLPAIFQRSGWRHSVRGRLLDASGAPLAGAFVHSVSLVGDRVYRGGDSSIPTDASGRFQILGGVFPGPSAIRAATAGDSIDVPITIPWAQPTNETYDVGELTVRRNLPLDRMRYCTVDLFTNATYESNSGENSWYDGQEFNAIAGSFTGGRFTGGRDTTDTNGYRTVIAVDATVDPATGEVLTLALTKTLDAPDGWTETRSLALEHVTMLSIWETPPQLTMQCAVDGEATCSKIADYTWSGSGPDSWMTMTGYDCLPDHSSGYISSLDVYFHRTRRILKRE